MTSAQTSLSTHHRPTNHPSDQSASEGIRFAWRFRFAPGLFRCSSDPTPPGMMFRPRAPLACLAACQAGDDDVEDADDAVHDGHQD